MIWTREKQSRIRQSKIWYVKWNWLCILALKISTNKHFIISIVSIFFLIYSESFFFVCIYICHLIDWRFLEQTWLECFNISHLEVKKYFSIFLNDFYLTLKKILSLKQNILSKKLRILFTALYLFHIFTFLQLCAIKDLDKNYVVRKKVR